jgi:hypothetical protein
MHSKETSINSQNYYSTGVQRVVIKLNQLGINVPEDALRVKPPRYYWSQDKISNIEYAAMDWFTGRDYEQAQTLIHFREQPQTNWHVIHWLDDFGFFGNITDQLMCRSLLDAIALIIEGADLEPLHLTAFRREGDSVVVQFGDGDKLRIEPIRIEPFNLAVRNRVQTAFKGIRQVNIDFLLGNATKLPGFKGREFINDIETLNPDMPMLLGFPGNWVYAMRNALKQIGIQVKQSEAQELVAAFFGAANWHQLVKHQDQLNDSMLPVCVAVKLEGNWSNSFYSSPEEAIFATGIALNDYPEPVVIHHFAPCLDSRRVNIWASTKEDMSKTDPMKLYSVPNCIECGGNDYCGDVGIEKPESLNIAKTILEDLSCGKTPEYDGTRSLREALRSRWW